MRSAIISLIVSLLGCGPGNEEESTCTPLSLELVQEFTEEGLVGDLATTDLPEEQGPGVGVGDLDNDGDLDLLLVVRGLGSFVILNDGDGNLTISQEATLDGGPLGEANGVAIADLDGDGDLDGILARPEGRPDTVIYNQSKQGSPLQFTAEDLPNSDGESMTPSLADADGDGDLDLFIGAYSHWFPPEDGLSDGVGLYLQKQQGGFSDATDRIPESVWYGLTFIGSWIDYDGDGDMDLYLANDCHNRANCAVSNKMLRNDGDANFEVDDECTCDHEMAAMGVAVGDPNGDGWPDMAVTNWGPPELYLNHSDSSFVIASDWAGLTPAQESTEITWGARFMDLNLDGYSDLLLNAGPTDLNRKEHPNISEQQRDVIFLNDGEGRFKDATETAGFDERGIGRSAVQADLDQDGVAEIIVVGHLFLRVWETKGGCPAGTTLKLDGPAGNSGGIGARVEVTTKKATTHLWQLPANSLSSSSDELYIGFGDVDEADISVFWPDGHTTELSGVGRGSVTTATHPDPL